MRDILLTLLVFGSLPFILRQPYLGILVWSWLSYMNPHRLTWGFAYDLPFAQIVAITLFISILINKESKRIPIDGTVAIWIIFLLWMVVTTINAIYVPFAVDHLILIFKIQIITFLTMMLITDQEKLKQLIWIIVISIGFFSVKGGIFTILSGGSFRVWGPESSFIEDNNALALTTLMIIPLIVYLYTVSKSKVIRYSLLFCALMSFAAVFGSQSRGALLAILAVSFFFWLKSRTKFITGTAVILLLVIGINFMPESWHERMDTIQNYEQDASAMGRINAWKYSVNIANDRITGGGLNSWSAITYEIYSPEALSVLVAHSIYFNVLADHGWPGLIMFLGILFLTWRTLTKIIKYTDKIPMSREMKNYNMLAKMIQVSLIAYLSGGAFLSLSYFDLPWHLIAMTVLIKFQIKELASYKHDSYMQGKLNRNSIVEQ
ncbi:MAG: putative O-glycosylation ligase, exosortase A system-associated [Sedimenticola sp.]